MTRRQSQKRVVKHRKGTKKNVKCGGAGKKKPVEKKNKNTESHRLGQKKH